MNYKRELKRLAEALDPTSKPATMHAEVLGKPAKEVEDEYASMLIEESLSRLAHAKEVRIQYEGGTPLEEMDADSLLSLALSYHPGDPPTVVLEAVETALVNIDAGDEVYAELDRGFFRDVLTTARERIAEGP